MDQGPLGSTADRRPAQRYDAPVFVLIHSPLLPPLSWLLVARELQRMGHEAVVPSLRGLAGAAEPRWSYARSAARAATAGIGSPLILAAHSAAGRLLPTIATALPNEVVGLLFVDAQLPPAAGSARLAPAALVELLRQLERDGLEPGSSWFRQELPPWIEPDRALEALMRERPRLPLSYFQERVPVPRNWTEDRCAYLCLSDAYAEAAAQARGYGWPVAALRDFHHLSVVTDPEAIASVLVDLADELSLAIPARGGLGTRQVNEALTSMGALR
jgi:hypothetical protein